MKHIKKFNESQYRDFDPTNKNDIKWTDIYTKYIKDPKNDLKIGDFIHWLRTNYTSPDFKTSESNIDSISDETIISRIEDIIHSEIYLRDVPYSMQDGAMEVDPDSAKDAAKSIMDMLREDGYIK